MAAKTDDTACRYVSGNGLKTGALGASHQTSFLSGEKIGSASLRTFSDTNALRVSVAVIKQSPQNKTPELFGLRSLRKSIESDRCLSAQIIKQRQIGDADEGLLRRLQGGLLLVQLRYRLGVIEVLNA